MTSSSPRAARRLAVCAAAAVLVGGAWGASPSASGAATASASATPASNARFVGNTSQRRRITFRVDSQKRIVDLRWTVKLTCGSRSQTQSIELTVPLRVRNGRFSTPTSSPFRVSGRFVTPRRAKGDLSLTYRSQNGRCRSGAVTFSARA